MGTYIHRAIIAAATEPEVVEEFLKSPVYRDLADSERLTILIGPVTNNGFQTVTFVPDGSKEGWPTNHRYSRIRDQAVEWFETHRGWLWIEVEYGETPDGPRVRRSYVKDEDR